MNGIATFGNVLVAVPQNAPIVLTATSSGLASATSTNVAVLPGPAAKIKFTASPPAFTNVGVAFASASSVQVTDAAGYLITDSTASITVAVKSSSTTPAGSDSAKLTGTSVLSCVGGAATFSGLVVDSAGNYNLVASSGDGSLTAATSTLFTMQLPPAVPTSLSIVSQPAAGASVVAGVSLSPAVTVVVLDQRGNTVLTSPPVTLTIKAGTGAKNAKLNGGSNVVVATVGGSAVFKSIVVNLAAEGYVFVASCGA